MLVEMPKPGEGAKMITPSKKEIEDFNESLNDELLKLSNDVFV